MNHKFAYKWTLADGYPAPGLTYHGAKVFGTFICGGGSTMGYKLAGFEHIGGVEIDKKVADVYQTNHNPKYLFNEDIRTFRRRDDLPAELFELDILDGSPPCSSFSMAGNRDKDWGKKKVFREGQTSQVLDDLFFEYIALAKRLRPKIVIAENVKGLITGNAKAYVKKIHEHFIDAGYEVQLFLLNAASMGVPQKRERVFFIAQRKDLKLPKLGLRFNEKVIYFAEIKGPHGTPNNTHEMTYWNRRNKSDKCFSDTGKRFGEKESNWNSKYIHLDEVCNTIVSASGTKLVEYTNPCHISDEKLKQIGSFPLDYNFLGVQPKYLIGMSVPPVMMAQIAHQIYDQWIKTLCRD